MTNKAKHEGPLKIPMNFDEAIKHALTVKPPPEGWRAYEKKLKGKKRKQEKRPRRGKAA